ncbi:MAG: alanine:cation symporter family protein [Bacteroidales bacterium]|jgi:AGCS family alanine or glycine:cation symporter|nr:alanine:cation symporter family protein [Bacteroidales bacterium]
MFEKIVSVLNEIIWSPVLVVLLVGAGLYFSIRTRFVQVRRFGLMIRSLFSAAEKSEDGKKHGISSFEAFCVALSGRVGTGNIVGVATAIALGGPGAIFWMWIIAFFGASTAFVESTLAQKYKFQHATGFRGGPASYIEKGLGLRWLSVLFSILVLVGYGMFLPTVQANGMAGALNNSFQLSPLAAGLGLATILGLVIIGGIKSIARVASVVTPFMALGYIVITLIVIARHIDAVPGVLRSIVTGAFGIQPVAGGILGSTIMMGVKRGIFSNEAGQGGGAIVSASAAVSHPAKQGLAQAFSVYVDTLLICTATALMILCSGTYNILDAKTGEMLVANVPQLSDNYVGFTQAAVDSVMTGFGGTFVSIALVFFVFTTVMAYYFYGESSIMQIFEGRPGKRKLERVCIWVFRFVLLGTVVFGALREANVIWQLGDVGVGLTAWINVAVLLLLCPQAIKALREYESSVKKQNPKK